MGSSSLANLPILLAIHPALHYATYRVSPSSLHIRLSSWRSRKQTGCLIKGIPLFLFFFFFESFLLPLSFAHLIKQRKLIFNKAIDFKLNSLCCSFTCYPSILFASSLPIQFIALPPTVFLLFFKFYSRLFFFRIIPSHILYNSFRIVLFLSHASPAILHTIFTFTLSIPNLP
nr:uncharacterized protein SPBC354.11c [Schizosaccharomyces pombe]O43025.1 RecName: Full=Putative uncharacterized membrane protein SPBC354.11c [Schizosaccharomyces pombe 972h-]CAA17811.1 dubious [Schizosaccharomyces pombe]|eukprot:NP_595235.1 uncharacterized protein SPBC354.11c [Schizosaccharomyces pombe]